MENEAGALQGVPMGTFTPPLVKEPTRSVDIKDLAAALAKAQGDIGDIKKNVTVSIKTKTSGTYKFNYADLAAIRRAIQKPLSDNGLSYTQFPAPGDKLGLVTRIMHLSGQWYETPPIYAPSQATDMKGLGGSYTYLRRYSLTMVLGIVSDDDLDASPADGDMVESAKTTQPTKKVPVTKPGSAGNDQELGKLKHGALESIEKLPEGQRAAWRKKVTACKSAAEVEKVNDNLAAELL